MQIQLPVIKGWNGAAFDANRFGADAVHAVSRRAVENGIFTGFAKRAHQQLDSFICAAANQHLLRFDASILRVILNHRFRLTLRVAVQRLLTELELHGGGIFIRV
ncbi:hypothetical protein SDC9_206583 [bioreactor metagenome]|uniref:Uncharacterized protein n=1 Tax=bioreactor metagenome TaxID=1076179 RepID=A0A645J651_9ZZZZ